MREIKNNDRKTQKKLIKRKRIRGGGQIDFQFCGDGGFGREGGNTISLISLCKNMT